MSAKRLKIETQQEFEDKIFVKLPKHFAIHARQKHAELAKKDLRGANLYLLDLQDAIEGAIDIDCKDDDLIHLAVEIVDKVRVLQSEDVGGSIRQFDLYEKLKKMCHEYGVRYPIEFDRRQILARLNDSAWWLRGLRGALAKRAEGVAIDAGLVHKKNDIYCSQDTLERRRAQRRRNVETLKNIDMVNTQTGEIMNLSDIAKTGAANNANRRAELITRVRGFEELAGRYGHASEFVTITCPSRMHAVLSNGLPNPKYDGTKPNEAQEYLVKNWARVRAQFARDGVKVYGLRIAEPHHDGSPHWHMILFYRNSLSIKYKMRAAFKSHFIFDEHFKDLDQQSQKDRLKNGIKFVSIKPSRGTSSGYVLKYVLKNVNGLEDYEHHIDEVDGEKLELKGDLYERVEAWAACWKIRQFQQIGGHYVTVWRELRRVEECKLEGKRPAFVKLWKACQRVDETKADYAEFIEAMGGLDTPPRKSLYMVDYELTMGRGRYGETVITKILGVGERFGLDVVGTSRADWVVM